MMIESLDLIGVGIGPGSFTVIRIAVSTARMLGQLLAIPVVGFTSHLIFASSIQCNIGDNILIAFDAKKGRVLGGIYKQTAPGTIPVEVVKSGDYQIDHLLGFIDPAYPTHSFGDGIEQYHDQIISVVPGLLHHEKFQHDPAVTCSIIRRIYNQNPEAYRDYNTVVPYYARRSYAEVARDEKL
jgi:tRNA threonylcarbamoyladenosine biosynthesis protein TsaB